MVAFIGIAATAFLLTIQPALAQISGFNASNIPTNCSTPCAPAINLTSSCVNSTSTDISCFCSTAIVNSLQTCLQCSAQYNFNNLTANQIPLLIGNLTSACAADGIPVTGVSSIPGSTSTASAAATSSTSAASMTTINVFGIMIATALGAVALL